MTKSIISRFIINGELLKAKSRMLEELAKDKIWASEVQEL